jgi:hypothetical protein
LSVNPNQLPEGQRPEGRRRIVIPIGKEQAVAARSGSRAAGGGNTTMLSAPRKSRAGKILAALAIALAAFVLLAAGGVFLWWQHYRTTPAYSLAVLVDAAQRNDMATVDTIVDTNQIVDNLALQVTDKAAGRYGVALSSVMRKQIETLAPKLSATIKQNVRDTLAARVKEISESEGHKPFVVLAVGLPFVVKVTVDGDTAKATTMVHDQQVDLDMRKVDNGWKVVGFRDDALVQRIIDQAIKELPVIGQGTDLDIRKQIKKAPIQLQPPW